MGAASKGAPKWIVLLEYKLRKKNQFISMEARKISN